MENPQIKNDVDNRLLKFNFVEPKDPNYLSDLYKRLRDEEYAMGYLQECYLQGHLILGIKDVFNANNIDS